MQIKNFEFTVRNQKSVYRIKVNAKLRSERSYTKIEKKWLKIYIFFSIELSSDVDVSLQNTKVLYYIKFYNKSFKFIENDNTASGILCAHTQFIKLD